MKRIALLLLLVAPVVAGDRAEDLARLLAKAMKSGQLELALQNMPEEMWAELATDPQSLHEFASCCAECAAEASYKDRDLWATVAERLEKACQSVRGEDADTADAHATKADACRCRAHADLIGGGKFNAEIWNTAANHFVDAHGKAPEKGHYLEQAARTLRVGARLGEDSALEAKAVEICARGFEQFPRNEYFASAYHAAQLREIAEVGSKDRLRGKRMLTAYLADLEAGKHGTGDTRDTAHTQAVTFARLHKEFGLKPKYVTRTIAVGGVWMELPLGSGWKYGGSRVSQYDAESALMRSITTDSYDWNTNYYLGNQLFGGDNIKGLARIGEADVLTVIAKPSYRRPVRRTRLSPRIRSTVGFEIGGKDEDGDYICYRWFYFQASEKKLTTYKVSILDFVESAKLDPEAEFVVSTMRETR